MKAYVITIETMEESVQAAERCIKSAKRYGVDVQKWSAITPARDPQKMFDDLNLATRAFDVDGGVYSRRDRCMAAFLSHRSIWDHISKSNEAALILEHDAYFVTGIQPETFLGEIISLGKPSYGKFNQPSVLGVGPLVSKRYFPGAHAYYMTPQGATEALTMSHGGAAPTDLFFHLDRFPDLKELYPWPVEARDHFTTIQKDRGCIAKHSYGQGYTIR